MAAYHWEARRKQILLDRRLALQARAAYERKQPEEAAGEVPRKQPSPPCPATELQDPSLEGATESRCPCNTEHVPNHSGKLLKRYSDFEYTQQW